jgi:hypothetical protein
LRLLQSDQEIAEACKRLIKNCIICWNYLYLSQKLAEIDDPVKREEFLEAMAHGSAAAWEHVNLLGEYDLSEETFKDSVGIKPPKLTD